MDKKQLKITKLQKITIKQKEPVQIKPIKERANKLKN